MRTTTLLGGLLAILTLTALAAGPSVVSRPGAAPADIAALRAYSAAIESARDAARDVWQAKYDRFWTLADKDDTEGLTAAEAREFLKLGVWLQTNPQP